MTRQAELIETERLVLRPLGLEGSRLQVNDRDAFFAWLGVPVPVSWPPPLNDESSMRYFLAALEADPSLAPWAEHTFVARSPRRVVGNGGFRGAPQDGVVEIGYSILEAEQGQGFATEAARALVNHALAQPGVRRVIAHTLVDGDASIHVLRKCGFVRAGDGPEPGVIAWAHDAKSP